MNRLADHIPGLVTCMLIASATSAQCQEGWTYLRAPVTNPPWPQLSGRCVASYDFDGPGGIPAQIALGGGSYGPIGQPASGAASSDGEAVTALPGLRSSVIAMITYQGSLYAGGEGFLNSNGPGSALARWTGSTWEGVGNISGQINALAVYNGELIVAGNFSALGTQFIPRIARFDGTTFSALTNTQTTATVRALCVHDGKLYVGGLPGQYGGVFSQSVASWDGSVWQAVPASPNGQLQAMTSFRGNLVVAGFAMSGQVFGSVQQFNGTSWSLLGQQITSPVYSIATRGDECFIGGPFIVAGNTPAQYIARMASGAATWSAMPDRVTGFPGLTTPITGIAEWDGAIVAVGNGTAAIWQRCRADFNCDSVTDFFDYLDFVSAFAGNEPAADFNSDEVIDLFDYLDFVQVFASGC